MPRRNNQKGVYRAASMLASAGLNYPGRNVQWRRLVKNNLEDDFIMEVLGRLEEDQEVLDILVEIADEVSDDLLEQRGMD